MSCCVSGCFRNRVQLFHFGYDLSCRDGLALLKSALGATFFFNALLQLSLGQLDWQS